MQSNHLWQPGEKIADRYRLNRLVGRGGVGEVWHAEDLALGRAIVIKTIVPEQVRGEQLERFAKEARVIAQLKHPGIVAVYDVGRDNNHRYIVMEFIEGPALAALVESGPISIGYGLKLANQVARALLYAHQKGILHRDIKPSNILIDGLTGDAKLTDFGLAKTLHEVQSITATGTVLGTPAYMSPEQFKARDFGPQSDIYSFGATLYYLFTGKIPHAGADMLSLAKHRAETMPAPLNELRIDVPPELNDTILRMLQPNPADRFASVSELVSIFEKLSAETPAPATTPKLLSAASSVGSPNTQVSMLKDATAPTGFFETGAFPKTQFFADDTVRYTKIQETLKFYRDHLNDEYQSLLKQANTTYRLWIGCVVLGFIVLVAGVVTMLTGSIGEGIATVACTIIVYFIQRIFQQREDHYRALAKAKNGHLEYGNQWLLVIQSIDSIEDQEQRMRRQEKLVDVLTSKLGAAHMVNGDQKPLADAKQSEQA